MRKKDDLERIYESFKERLEQLIDQHFGPGWRDLNLDVEDIIRCVYKGEDLEVLV